MFRNIAAHKFKIAGALVASGVVYYESDSSLINKPYGLVRHVRAITTLGVIAADYKFNLKGDTKSDEYLKMKSECHQRSADRLLKLFRTNGGIYIKLGQHIASLIYLLPREYTQTMTELQDDCPPCTLDQVNSVMLKDMGKPLSQVFESFDPEPIGVASLAQVHKATIKRDGKLFPVAVKVQHHYLDDYKEVDLYTCSTGCRIIKWLFPDFEFQWLANEIEKNFPVELDFRIEHLNADKARLNFKNIPEIIIPKVEYSDRRILIMEYIDGAKVTDMEYIEKHGIKKENISILIGKMYSEMIFKHSVVLLDHGLYRELEPDFVFNYAQFWKNIILGNEEGIERYAYSLFRHTGRKQKDGIDYHRLFASMVSARSWDAITSKTSAGFGGIVTTRQTSEVTNVQNKAGNARFLEAISKILSQCSGELLLIIKSNDLIRSIDQSLKVDQGRHVMKLVNQLDKSIPLVEVVQAFQIFESDNHSNQGIAMKPNKATLSNAFGTEDENKIIEKILSEGKVMHTVNNGGSKGYVA
ncbi:putative aarF domain-containing protein kinase 1 [Boothiomyces sp. JEL0838]|nr:putative aarF domain-containing protein kinase 1 [Boothiomyces sp. JEL0838]